MMKRTATLSLIGLSVFLTGFLKISALGHEGHNKAFETGETVSVSTQKITITKDGQKAIGLQTLTVKPTLLRQSLRVTGQVKPADNHFADLSAPMPGLVRSVNAKEGDTVKKGQTLAVIYSPEATRLLSELLQQKALLERESQIQRKQKELAKTTLDREVQLYKEGISPKKDLLSAKNAMEVADISINAYQRQLSVSMSAARSQLRVMGMSDATINRALSSGQVSSEIAIVAPISGTVSKRDITLGETVDLSKTLFSIVNLQPAWILVDVFQEQLTKIKLGQIVNITTASGEKVTGQISTIGSAVDPIKRTVSVRIVSDNPNGTLKPDLFVTADILTSESQHEGIVIPQDTVVEENGRSLIYVQYNDAFQPVVVQLGQKTADTVEVLDGLYEGDQVVVKGANQVRAQSLIAGSKEAGEEDHHDGPTKSELPLPLIIVLTLTGGVVIGAGSVVFLNQRKGK